MTSQTFESSVFDTKPTKKSSRFRGLRIHLSTRIVISTYFLLTFDMKTIVGKAKFTQAFICFCLSQFFLHELLLTSVKDKNKCLLEEIWL